jgi:CheY-like chemotaxis protein
MPEKRILLIEDEATTREILTDLLRGEGYAVDSVATAGAASTCLDAIFYELVVTDWVLPDGDGTDIADTAAQLGSKTLIITGQLTALPPGVADRHELRSKELGYPAILAAVRRAIGDPEPKPR